MAITNEISKHYRHGRIIDAIEQALVMLGKTVDTVSIDDLAPVDEFHIGGRAASEAFLKPLGFSRGMDILDIGCGLGGGARFTAETTEAHVTGIDLTDEYIEAGRVLNSWVGLDTQVTLSVGNATQMPFRDGGFDGAYMMHVGMNIEDKSALFKDVFRVLKSGTCFGIYDIMQTAEGDIVFPVPWAAGRATSHLITDKEYIKILEMCGFKVSKTKNRREFALSFFQKIQAANKENGGPAPLGLHTLMQASTKVKITNMVKNITDGLISPIEITAHKP